MMRSPPLPWMQAGTRFTFAEGGHVYDCRVWRRGALWVGVFLEGSSFAVFSTDELRDLRAWPARVPVTWWERFRRFWLS